MHVIRHDDIGERFGAWRLPAQNVNKKSAVMEVVEIWHVIFRDHGDEVNAVGFGEAPLAQVAPVWFFHRTPP